MSPPSNIDVKREGSEFTDCYVIVNVGGDVGRIASGVSPFISHFRVEGMVWDTKYVVH